MFSMQASVSQVKGTIMELETAGEEQSDDISSLVIIYFFYLLSSKQTQILQMM